MKLVILDGSAQAVMASVARVESLSRADASALALEVIAAGERDFLEKLAGADVLLLGPHLGSRAPLLARAARSRNRDLHVLALVSDATAAKGDFILLRGGDVKKILPESASTTQLAHELHSISLQLKGKRLRPGHMLIGDRYEIVKYLGSGSMGLVYACRHRELRGHLLAIKVLFPEVTRDEKSAKRFKNEIMAAYGVSHKNVVRAYEYLHVGELVGYTMEYVDGGDLADRLLRLKSLPIPEAVKILSQVCAGVFAVHSAGIIHRDLKPENILLTNDGTVKIADFGIARREHGPTITERGGVLGTLDYISPEYVLNSQFDCRSDIYAIGILGYEMITGRSPFNGDSVYAIMTARLKDDPIPPHQLRPDCQPQLSAIILKAMLRDPEERYQSAAEMYGDLAKLL